MSVCRMRPSSTIDDMDLLADVLELSGVRGTLGARIDAGAGWGSWVEPVDKAAFHAVTAGTAWVAVGERQLQLLPGDVLLLPARQRARDRRRSGDPGADLRRGP